MKKPARYLAVAAGAAALTLLIAGCGVSGSANTASKVAGCTIPSENQKSGELGGKVTGTITFETLGLKGSFSKFFIGQIARFEKKYPGTKVNWIDDPGGAEYQTRLTTDIRVCKIPDVINADIQGVAALSNVGLTMDMADRLPGVKSNYTSDMWNSAKSPKSGQIAALPWYTGMPAMIYNKTLLKQAGLQAPPSTYSEYFGDLGTIAQKSDGQFQGDWGNQLYALPNAFASQGVKIMNANHTKFTFGSDPAAVKWLENLAVAYKEGAFPKDSISGSPDSSQAYAAGKLVFSQASLRYLKENAPKIYADSGVVPYLFDKLGGPLINGQYVAVPKTSKNAVTALAFAKFMTSIPEQQAWCSDNGVQPIPPMAKIGTDAQCWTDPSYDSLFGKYMKVQEKSLLAAKSDPIIWFWSGGVSNVVTPDIQKAMLGTLSAKDALKDAEDKANRILARTASE